MSSDIDYAKLRANVACQPWDNETKRNWLMFLTFMKEVDQSKNIVEEWVSESQVRELCLIAAIRKERLDQMKESIAYIAMYLLFLVQIIFLA